MAAVSLVIVQPAAAAGAEESKPGEAGDDSFGFTSGNPKVERVTGRVHLYRPVDACTSAQAQAGPTPRSHAAPLPLTDTLCALSVPGTVSIGDFWAFCGALAARIRELRLVTTEEGAAARDRPAPPDDAFAFSVIIRFDAPASAEEFYRRAVHSSSAARFLSSRRRGRF